MNTKRSKFSEGFIGIFLMLIFALALVFSAKQSSVNAGNPPDVSEIIASRDTSGPRPSNRHRRNAPPPGDRPPPARSRRTVPWRRAPRSSPRPPGQREERDAPARLSG